MPEFIVRMVEQGKLGRKAGGGFYKKDATSGEIVVIDPQTVQYRTKAKVRIESLGVAHNEEDVVKRVRGVLAADDRAGRFAWKLTAETLVYAARRLGEIADDVVNVDRAMRWGFNWDMGPFELLDALGVRETAARLEQDRYEVPEVIRAVAASPAGRFYLSERGEARYFDLGRRELRPVPARPGAVSLADSKAAGKVIRSNLGASLIDLGDGVALLEFHSKANAIDDDVLNLTHAALDEVERNFQGLVIANEGQNFCVGANLMLLWMESQQANWTAIEQMVRAFQDLCQRLGTSARPVVVAPHAMALGGGCEMAMGASRMVLAGETYMGLVEVGVGIIPGGGGNKEMLRRILGAVPPETQVDPLPFVARAFQTVALARVSTSAVEAQELRYAAPSDRIVVARDRLVGEAKAEVLHMAAHGYRPRRLAAFRLPGANGRATLLMQLDAMRAGGHISDHDMRIGRALATVMTGGDCSPSQPVTEQHLLDVEREQFMSLCGEEKTQARMQHMLMHGKPLRN
jgi:3-hydroxyacyl-CoA dehydrogenase